MNCAPLHCACADQRPVRSCGSMRRPTRRKGRNDVRSRPSQAWDFPRSVSETACRSNTHGTRASKMSLWRDELKTSHATNATLVVLAAVSIGSLGRVVQAPGLYAWAIPAVVFGVACALFFGRRSLGLGFALLLVGGILSLPILFAHRAPSPGGFKAVLDLARQGLHSAGASTPPVPAAN